MSSLILTSFHTTEDLATLTQSQQDADISILASLKMWTRSILIMSMDIASMIHMSLLMSRWEPRGMLRDRAVS